LKGSERGQTIAFADPDAQARFFRHMRLLADDINELSSAVGILIALEKRANDRALLSTLNRHPVFWNSILASLSTTVFIVMGRIHDKDSHAYFKEIRKVLRSRPYLSDVLLRFEAINTTHRQLIEKALTARHNVFGHSSFDRPRYVAVGLRGKWEEFVLYWHDLSEAAKDIMELMFPPGTDYGPKIDSNLLDGDISGANRFLDEMVQLSGSKEG
jgi:hypothetical protein